MDADDEKNKEKDNEKNDDEGGDTKAEEAEDKHAVEAVETVKPTAATDAEVKKDAQKDDQSGSDDDQSRLDDNFILDDPIIDLEDQRVEEYVFSRDLSIDIERPPDYHATMGVPKACKPVFFAYEASEETKNLLSEATRSIFAELFVSNDKLGPLSELCVRVLARHNTPLENIPNVDENPEYVRIYFEEVPLGMTIEKTLPIENESYWKRLVLEKHHDKSLSLQEKVNWKNIGISLLLAEKVEASAPEYWINEDLLDLAERIRPYITELTLSKLKCQSERTFDQYYENAENESWGSSMDSDDDFVPEEEYKKTIGTAISPYDDDIELEMPDEIEENDDDIIEEIMPEHEATPPPPPPPKKKKRKKKKKGLSIIDIEVEPSESEIREQELEEEKCDRRNMEKFLNKIRNFNYPTKICHHIDLSFIKYFDYLEEFNLSFSGDGLVFDYGEKHLKFSYRDMSNLAIGLAYLYNLKIFRLTKSRMDKRKLKIVVKALIYCPSLEVVDFGLDHLKDNCGRWFYELISKSNTIRRLELESNELSTNVMRWIGSSFRKHEGSILEYLGLARNPIGDSGLKHLFKGLVGTHHCTTLNLTGISCKTSGVISIAKELIAKHPYVRHLYLTAIDINTLGAAHLIHALIQNITLLTIDVRCCGLDYTTELEVAILQKRNQFVNESSADPNLSMDELQNWLKRVKHPVLLKVMSDVKKYNECIANRPPQFEYSEPSIGETGSENAQSEHTITDYDPLGLCIDSETSTFEYPVIPKQERLQFNYDELTEKEFVHCGTTGGPENRYKYFRAMEKRHQKVARRRQSVQDDVFTRQSFD